MGMRSQESDCPMISGCPIDRNILFCVIHYAPELMLLVTLALVGIAGVAMRRSQQR